MTYFSNHFWPFAPLCCALSFLPPTAANQPAVAPPIVRRHDVSDARFLEFGEQFNCLAYIGGGCGTVIAPDWILTAAHVGNGVSYFRRHVRINGEEYEVKRKLVHPGFAQNPPGKLDHDIALLQLTRPVTGVEPIKLYRESDELGQVIIFLGNGSTGTGKTGPDQRGRRQKRASTNTVSEASKLWLTFDFNAPSDAEVTPLEGISGPGDSGGPCLLQKGDELFVMGVSSWNSGDGAGAEGLYQTTEHYPRVSAYAKWIDETIADPPASSALPRPTPFTDVGLANTVHGQIAKGYLDMLNGMDMEAFFDEHVATSPLTLVSGMTLNGFEDVANEFTTLDIQLTCLEFLENGANITLFVEFSKAMDIGARFAAITLHFNDANPPRLRSLSSDFRMTRE
jgi:hypothetical protein